MRVNVWVVLHTLLSYFLAGFVCLFLVLPAFLLILFYSPLAYSRSKFMASIMHLLYSAIVKITLLPVEIIGPRNNVSCAVPSIIVSNHASALDIPFLAATLDYCPHMWYALSYYLSMPILGTFLRRMALPVVAGNASATASQVRRGLEIAAKSPAHIMIFPEGGRYVEDQVQRFMTGYIYLAQKTGRPIVPVYMHNLGKAYPPHSFFIYRQPITIVIGQPFVYTPDHETVHEFNARVRAWFIEQQHWCNTR